MPPQIIFEMDGVSKAYGDKVVLSDISLGFYYGAKIGIVGENGSGKSTLLRIMAGLDKDIHGQVRMSKGMRVGYIAQEPQLDLDKTVRQNLTKSVASIQQLIDEYNSVSEQMGDPDKAGQMDDLLEKMGKLQEQIDACGGWEVERLMDIASDALVLPPDDMPVKLLSGGERRRVALCMALLEKPDLLLLDEPTNHLDAETVAWLENALREYPGTVIIVTHDRYFLDNITKWILELENGRGLPFEGNYSSWLRQKAELLRMLEKKETERQRTLARELEWISSSAKGRNQKNQARINRYEELAGRSFEVGTSETVIQIAPGPRLGDKVLIADRLTKGYDDTPLLKDCSFNLPRGAVVGVIGPNGSGKTTLLRMIVGQEKPDAGRLELGPSIVLSYVDQNRDALDAQKTVFEEITGGKDKIELGSVSMNSRAYVARFNFRGPQQQKLVGELSGGERNRVHLAKLLRRGGNLILLDEPTNDLDVATMRVLEQAIIEFPGCVMVISHDRFFLDRICTHLLIIEGAGRTTWFTGNFQAYEQSLLDAGSDRLAHRRGKYKRLALR
ncbi:MAG: energy-dependent translational throttle protein EttA [Planctomycetes bacterium]|nr:energy-dependent translational throttle protein EttA [Planctomycetota bacterium]